ncbi:MAG: AraC family transcriptional regulator [Synergistaceae bacterium]|nr:AraC family transcriptional regulator [Synergistaceae bacterium]
MFADSCTVKFEDHAEFFKAITEMGKATSALDNNTRVYETPFASVRLESCFLIDNVEIVIFKIHPTVDIHIQYEFDNDYLEIGYLNAGRVLISDNGHEGRIRRANNLLISPPEDFRGNIVFYRDQPSEAISFHTSNNIIRELLGESGDELWTETRKGDNFRENSFPPAPSGIASSFLQIINCDYPSKAKLLFFESKFREILARIVAGELPAEETFFLGEFEKGQIGKIPRILTDRIDNPPSIHELTLELSLNATTMQRGFKKMFGAPIYVYHRNMRLEHAAIMLLDTHKSIFEIAIEAGYSGSGNFCNAFKKHYGVSPGQYRQKGGLFL